ncbi:MAG: T9SS type A sorting domain-containing protein, partial [Bacteroidetes bacterium]|nr:T9SS type A sorting domain-containing protein [Bacteroidota bacterium]
VLRDSFFVLPASFDRTLSVRIGIESEGGFGDSESFDVFVPKIATSAAGDVPAPAAFRLVGLHPNPVAPGQPLLVDVESRGSLRLEVFDALGRECWHTWTPEGRSGRQRLSLRLPMLREGLYHLRVHDGDMMQTRRFVVLR